MNNAPRRKHHMTYFRKQIKKEKRVPDLPRDLRLVKRLDLINAFINTNFRAELYLAQGVQNIQHKAMWKVIETDMTFQEHIVKLEEDRLLWKQWNRGNQTDGRACSKNAIPHVCTCDQHVRPTKKPKVQRKVKLYHQRSTKQFDEWYELDADRGEYGAGICGCCCNSSTNQDTLIPITGTPIRTIRCNITTVSTSTPSTRINTTALKHSSILRLGPINEQLVTTEKVDSIGHGHITVPETSNQNISVISIASIRTEAASSEISTDVTPNNDDVDTTEGSDGSRTNTDYQTTSPTSSTITNHSRSKGDPANSSVVVGHVLSLFDKTVNTDITYPLRVLLSKKTSKIKDNKTKSTTKLQNTNNTANNAYPLLSDDAELKLENISDDESIPIQDNNEGSDTTTQPTKKSSGKSLCKQM